MVQDVPEMVSGELRIDRYVVESKLGEGGMADVWLCRLAGARGFSKRVVIKTIKPECRNEQYETMFLDEANIGARLEHPNIPRVTEFGQTRSGVLFLVQEYVEGPSVQQIIAAQRATGSFDLRLAARIGSDVASALDFAHRLIDERGRPLEVIHRDVSTSNILVSRRGPAKLIDFGVARFTDRETHTQTGILKGKLRYMAPEMVSGGPTSHRSDLYALGQVLYRLFVGRSPQGLLGSSEFITPSVLRPEIDPALDAILMDCLQVNPERRVEGGDVLARRLDRWALAHGGVVSDGEAASRLAALFPGGVRDWQLHASIDTLNGADPLPLNTAPLRRRRMPPSVVAAGFGFAAVLLVAGALMWVSVSTPQPLVERPGLESLLDAADAAIGEGRWADAEAIWQRSTRVEAPSDSLMVRREVLTTEVRIHRRIVELRELGARDPAEARMQAHHLLHDYPDRSDVIELLEQLGD